MLTEVASVMPASSVQEEAHLVNTYIHTQVSTPCVLLHTSTARR